MPYKIFYYFITLHVYWMKQKTNDIVYSWWELKLFITPWYRMHAYRVKTGVIFYSLIVLLWLYVEWKVWFLGKLHYNTEVQQHFEMCIWHFFQCTIKSNFKEQTWYRRTIIMGFEHPQLSTPLLPVCFCTWGIQALLWARWEWKEQSLTFISYIYLVHGSELLYHGLWAPVTTICHLRNISFMDF